MSELRLREPAGRGEGINKQAKAPPPPPLRREKVKLAELLSARLLLPPSPSIQRERESECSVL